MARIDNKLLFFTTSPRTPAKMIPEIRLLHEKFAGKSWNNITQEQFIDELAASSFFEGKGSPSDKAFSARDRINRAPKALGFTSGNVRWNIAQVFLQVDFLHKSVKNQHRIADIQTI